MRGMNSHFSSTSTPRPNLGQQNSIIVALSWTSYSTHLGQTSDKTSDKTSGKTFARSRPNLNQSLEGNWENIGPCIIIELERVGTQFHIWATHGKSKGKTLQPSRISSADIACDQMYALEHHKQNAKVSLYGIIALQ